MAPRNDNLFPFDLPLYHCQQLDKDEFVTEEEVEAALWEIARKEWGGIEHANGLKWKLGPKCALTRKRIGTRQVIRCHDWNLSKCRWCTEVIRDMSAGFKATIRVARTCHLNGHQVTVQKRGVLSQALAVSITSPGRLGGRPSVLLAKVRHQGITVDEAQEKAFKRHVSRKRLGQSLNSIEDKRTTTGYGQLRQKLENFKRQSLLNFNEHNTYLVGDHYHLDSDKEELIAVFSTENLVLNAYRQLNFGCPVFWYVDASHKYTMEGYPLFPVKVVCGNTQVGHVIAYGVVSHDNQSCHQFVFDSIKLDVERIINDRLDRGFTTV